MRHKAPVYRQSGDRPIEGASLSTQHHTPDIPLSHTAQLLRLPKKSAVQFSVRQDRTPKCVPIEPFLPPPDKQTRTRTQLLTPPLSVSVEWLRVVGMTTDTSGDGGDDLLSQTCVQPANVAAAARCSQ